FVSEPTRPKLTLKPKSPLYADGMRIDPPPSLPVHIGIMPTATAAAEPPEEPPGVRSGFHGLRVTPWMYVRVQLTDPYSGDVVSQLPSIAFPQLRHSFPRSVATFAISAKASSIPLARTSRSPAASRSAHSPKCKVPS